MSHPVMLISLTTAIWRVYEHYKCLLVPDTYTVYVMGCHTYKAAMHVAGRQSDARKKIQQAEGHDELALRDHRA